MSMWYKQKANISGGSVNWHDCFGELYVLKLNIWIPKHSVNPSLYILNKTAGRDTHGHQNTCTGTFTAALFQLKTGSNPNVHT